jgi:hypothetical protein
MAPITHIVLFEFRPGTVQAVVQDVRDPFTIDWTV